MIGPVVDLFAGAGLNDDVGTPLVDYCPPSSGADLSNWRQIDCDRTRVDAEHEVTGRVWVECCGGANDRLPTDRNADAYRIRLTASNGPHRIRWLIIGEVACSVGAEGNVLSVRKPDGMRARHLLTPTSAERGLGERG